jgi:hypothetical protein
VAASSHRARGRSPATLAVQTSTTARGYRDNLNAQMDVPVVADQGSSGRHEGSVVCIDIY